MRLIVFATHAGVQCLSNSLEGRMRIGLHYKDARELEDRLTLLDNVFDRIDEIDKTVNELKTTMGD